VPLLATAFYNTKLLALVKDCVGEQQLINVISVADPDTGSGEFLPQGSGSGMNFFPDPGSRIHDPYDVPNSIYLQDFTCKNGEKQ
jgi:hypothetical protein